MELHSNANLIKKMLTPIINRKAKQDHVTLHPVVKFYRSPEYSLDLYADPPESYSVDSRKMGSYSHRNYFDDLRSSQNEQARKNNGSSMKQHSFDKDLLSDQKYRDNSILKEQTDMSPLKLKY